MRKRQKPIQKWKPNFKRFAIETQTKIYFKKLLWKGNFFIQKYKFKQSLSKTLISQHSSEDVH